MTRDRICLLFVATMWRKKTKNKPAKIHADFNLEEACIIPHAALSDFFNS